MTGLLPIVNDAGVHVSNWQGEVIIQLIARKIIVALGSCNITNELRSIRECKPHSGWSMRG